MLRSLDNIPKETDGETLLPIIRKLCHLVGWNTNQSGNACIRAASRTVMTRPSVGWRGRTAWKAPFSEPVPARIVGHWPSHWSRYDLLIGSLFPPLIEA